MYQRPLEGGRGGEPPKKEGGGGETADTDHAHMPCFPGLPAFPRAPLSPASQGSRGLRAISPPLLRRVLAVRPNASPRSTSAAVVRDAGT